MPKIVVTVPHTHPMIPSFKETVEKIKTLGYNAQPKSSTGLQTENPSTVIVEGGEETLNVLKTEFSNVRFA